MKGKAFSILGGLSFLTFLGVLLYQLATQSAASGRVMDANAPLLMSDIFIDPMANTLLTQDLTEPPSMVTAVEDEEPTEGETVDQMAGVFNGLWRAHRTTGSYRCTQRRICETLTANQNIVHEPLIQTAT